MDLNKTQQRTSASGLAVGGGGAVSKSHEASNDRPVLFCGHKMTQIQSSESQIQKQNLALINPNQSLRDNLNPLGLFEDNGAEEDSNKTQQRISASGPTFGGGMDLPHKVEPPSRIMSDDFPELSFLKKQSSSLYAAVCNKAITHAPELINSHIDTDSDGNIAVTLGNRVTSFSSQQCISIHTASKTTLLPNITGLACCMIANLHILKDVFELAGIKPEQLQEKTPIFAKFLQNNIHTIADVLSLYKEMSTLLAEDSSYSLTALKFGLVLGVGEGGVTSGLFRSAWPEPMTVVLLHKLNSPLIYFKQENKSPISNWKNQSYHSAQTLTVDYPTQRFLSNSGSAGVSMQELASYTLQRKNRSLAAPVPSVLVVMVSHMLKYSRGITVSNPFDQLIFNTDTKQSITYQLKSILCFHSIWLGGHAYVITKKGNDWHEINDNVVRNLGPDENVLSDQVSERGVTFVYEKR